jgi:hypothetical protein
METQRGVEYEDDAGERREQPRRTGGKRTVYGDLPGEAADAGAAAYGAVDAFWRDALESIN